MTNEELMNLLPPEWVHVGYEGWRHWIMWRISRKYRERYLKRGELFTSEIGTWHGARYYK
jgi:hypothetical protein